MIDLFGVRITGELCEERAEAVLAWDLLNFEPKAIDFAIVPANVGEPLFKALWSPCSYRETAVASRVALTWTRGGRCDISAC
jgi:hypothetical protein